MQDKQAKTIRDFGQQWLAHQGNEGYYGSTNLLADILLPLLDPKGIEGCKVAEIGSGTGRIVNMLLSCGAAHVTALEPSAAFNVLQQNTSAYQDRITYLNVTGDALPPSGDLDYVFSIGVLHHIPEPLPSVQAAYHALRPEGRFLIWLYGCEGNTLYLLLVQPIRALTPLLPDPLLQLAVHLIDIPLTLYIYLCHLLPLPLHQYMRGYLSKLSPSKRRLVIFDQLNPSYAKYYTRQECLALLEKGGFVDIKLHHRHGYSWTAIGTKPL